jgi:hypothetical protein
MNKDILGETVVTLFSVTRYATLLFGALLVLYILGCATIKYSSGGEIFSSSDEALAKQLSDLAKVLEAIKPTTTPVHGKTLIVIPTREELCQHYVVIRGSTANVKPEQINYMCSYLENDQNMLAKAIQKKELFDQVTIMNMSDPANAPIGKNDFLIYRDIDGWFIKSQESSTKRIVMDANSPPGISRTNSFLDSLEERAHSMTK